ncbi:hypothetical protein JZY91_03810 [Corynebacterium sp. CNCTC7651]|uniref:Rv1157c family protein n=1 Tax=Corynebacterium sp. CNCTC7651 TaxID=2815361 RepID=UPI001F1D5340|nr:hypothetical protein [Corynebacterium sp. CNCTC7651]UIZ92884.1 hypothetical protein JZY91_03810 [Corynebacterium sp. CNCTC7651]
MRFFRPLTRAATCAVAAAAIAVGAAAATPAAAQSSVYLDELGRPTDHTVQRVNAFADQPFVPPQVANALRTAVNFYAGTGELGGPPLPEDAPPFTQFYWPTVSSNCIGEGLHSTASALVVPGPATTPAPGAGPGEATFVFTALGTPAAAPEQGELRAYWINIDNLRTGVTQLGNNQINPLGPATLSGTANTGPGRVLAVIDGHVRTADNVCAFAPTAATFSVR